MEYSDDFPIQYQEGKANFMDMDIFVDPSVLIPRPETEILVRVTAELCKSKGWHNPDILDLCTGSGIVSIGLTKLLTDCSIVGSDVCNEALAVAKKNIDRFNPEGRIKLVESDMFEKFESGYEGVFDCIVSNPPYVSSDDYRRLDPWVKAEPKKALYAGKNGMDFHSMIAAGACSLLKDGGFIAVEVGYDQADRVKLLFCEHEFVDISGIRDFDGHERVIIGWKHG